jgi:HD-GYP domain-containing protein (c-di-GMP phosphodiesterase class II)
MRSIRTAADIDFEFAMSPRPSTTLRKLEPDEIPLGQQLPFDIFDEQGSLFKRAGLTLRKLDIARAKARLKTGLFIRINEEEEAQRKAIATASANRVKMLQEGDRLSHDVLDMRGRLIQAAGTPVTPQLMRFLDRNVFRAVCVEQEIVKPEIVKLPMQKHVGEPEDFSPFAAAQLEQEVRVLLQTTIKAQVRPEPEEKRLELQQLRQEISSGQAKVKSNVALYADLASQSLAGRVPNLVATESMIHDMTRVIDRDPNLALLMMDLHNTHQGDYLFNHGMNTSLVAMRVAGRLGWDKPSIQALGVAALCQDLGMLQIPDEIRMARRPLKPEEIQFIRQHPYFTVNQLQRSEQLNPLTMLLAFQSHELADGSGYPRQRHTGTIHPLAQVLHAADMFCAMTCPRPFRKAHAPYSAVVELLNHARDGKLDRNVARAFVDSVSLFPVGSYVRLSNGISARVIQTNGPAHTRPRVVPLNSDGTETDVTLNLLEVDNLKITAAITPQAATGQLVLEPEFKRAS